MFEYQEITDKFDDNSSDFVEHFESVQRRQKIEKWKEERERERERAERGHLEGINLHALGNSAAGKIDADKNADW